MLVGVICLFNSRHRSYALPANTCRLLFLVVGSQRKARRIGLKNKIAAALG